MGKITKIYPENSKCVVELKDKEWVEEEHNNTTRISFLKLWH